MPRIYRVEITRIQVATAFVTVPDEMDLKGRSPESVYTDSEVFRSVQGLDWDESDYETDWSDAMTTEELEDDEEYGCVPEGTLPVKQVKPRGAF